MFPQHCPHVYAVVLDRESVLQMPFVLILRQQLAATAFMYHVVGFGPTVWDVGICDI